ncbi:hypothetical protein WH52_13700 [Tenacibaculum holothuriorum]|uniref:Uncharacterized protein n=1 Tax=Tenacibaculum holothuriorum TaxID=1635173 RepID=A0A1Y2PA96_9FLAO|nr:hypothetical protein [Tenacibaculum holothuriorum]OSY86951.1 hypothetical protein WH52_13700 [Tenacibaculum holothuriorum]
MEENSTNKSWLQRLKDESWEAELLVSAIAIFGAFKLFDLVKWAANFFIDKLNPDQYIIAYFITFFSLIAVSALVSMFVIHFVLRAYWVGLVGLNSVFPDYSIEDTAYSKIYTKKILAILPKLKDSIQKVDELCSVIFSVAFTFLFIYGYIALFTSIYLLLFNILSKYVPKSILLIPAILIAVGAMIQTIVSLYSNLKQNKEKEKLQQLNFTLVKYANMMLFGPLYKNLLQVFMIFGSNFKKKKSLSYLILLFLFSGSVVAGIQLRNTNIFYLVGSNYQRYFDPYKTYSNYYKDTSNTNFLLTPEIQSDLIKSNVVEVFIPIFDYESSMRESICGKYEKPEDAPREERIRNRANYLKECYKKYHNIFLDNKKIDVSFLRYDNHHKTDQFGIVSFLNIKDLPEGLHELKIEKINSEGAYLYWTIPFYKSSQN